MTTGGESFCSGIHVIVNSVVPHHARYCFFRHSKGATKATVSFEHIDELFRHRLRFFHATAVRHRLPTASLIRREYNFDAEVFQHRTVAMPTCG